MNPSRRHLLKVAAAAGALAALTNVARADAYPSRPITLVVPFSPGGLADFVGRIIGEALHARLGETVVIENVTGANGSIGTGRVARAAPDGYTLLLGIWNTHVANAATYNLSYDVVNDFAPIILLADAPLLLAANKRVPADTCAEFIAWLKANSGKASLGTVGAGSPGHLLGILLQQQTGTTFTQVAYRGAGPAMQDVVAGQIDGMFVNPATAMAHVRAGTIKAYLVTAGRRLAIAPDIPAVDEVGLASLHFSLWAGLFAPHGTPQEIIARLDAAGVAAMSDPAVREKLASQGYELPSPDRQTPAALAAYQKAEIAKWWPIIKAAGIKPE